MVSVSATPLPKPFLAAARVLRMDTSDGITFAGFADMVVGTVLIKQVLSEVCVDYWMISGVEAEGGGSKDF